MSCKHEAKVSAYHDGELPEAARQELEEHLSGCSECQRTLQHLVRLSDHAAPLRQSTVSNSLLSKLRSIPAREPWGDLLPTARLLLGLAAILLVASVGLSKMNGHTRTFAPQGWEELVTRDSDAEILDEPEVEITRWVVAGLTEGSNP